MYKIIIFMLIFVFIPVELFAFDNKEVIKHKGKIGVFLDDETFTKIIQDLAEFQILKQEKLPELENKIRVLQSDLKLLETELEVTEEISDKWKNLYLLEVDLRVKETTRLQELLDKKGVWYKSPAFTFNLGLIGGGLLAVGIAWGLSSATNQELWNL